jgi:aromatic-L-amino-acid decarboxylase
VSSELPNALGDIPAETFRRLVHEVADWIADYRETIATRPVSQRVEPGSLLRALPGRGPEAGEPLEAILRDVDKLIMPAVTHWGHPHFTGYFGSTTTGPGILAEMITAALNVNAMTWRVSPAATELETAVLEWLRQWLDLPTEFRGVVYDTASIGTMHAMAVAREEATTSMRDQGFTGRNIPVLRIYASDQAHSSVEKAAIALGLGERNVRRVPSDSQFKLEIAALETMISEDLSAGYRPMAIVATVGTTSTASVDPVARLSEICRRHRIWLHVDAAYGGGLALLPEFAWIKVGWVACDSLVMNPHKMLFVPFDFSALYVRDITRLKKVFALIPEYLRGDAAGADTNYMDYGVQLGRRFRALKAWVVWRTFGREGLAARIREHMRLALQFAGWVASDKRFELLAPVVMGVVCFGVRAHPVEEAARLNAELVRRVNDSGKMYLTVTQLHADSAIRLGLGNILTTEDHLFSIWSTVRDVLGTLEEERKRKSLHDSVRSSSE